MSLVRATSSAASAVTYGRVHSLNHFRSDVLVGAVIGMILLATGFNFRDKPVGVFGMWIGMLLILGTVVYKILAKLAE